MDFKFRLKIIVFIAILLSFRLFRFLDDFINWNFCITKSNETLMSFYSKNFLVEFETIFSCFLSKQNSCKIETVLENIFAKKNSKHFGMWNKNFSTSLFFLSRNSQAATKLPYVKRFGCRIDTLTQICLRWNCAPRISKKRCCISYCSMP